MEKSLFIEYIDKYFRPVIGKLSERFNGKTAEAQYFHKTMLMEEYSADLRWDSSELNHSIVAADVVAMDSSLPLKKRSAIARASGSLPKVGVKYRKGEKTISDINVMIARGASEATVAQKIFDDAAKVVKAIDVRKEIMFLQALSTGTVLTSSDDDTSIGIRADFGYRSENTFKADTAWDKAGATPINDLAKLFAKANSDSGKIAHVYMSQKYFNYLRASTQGKGLAASFRNHVVLDPATLTVPTPSVFLEALQDEFGAVFHVVNSSFKLEQHDGSYKSITPWEQGNVVAVPDTVVGRLVYGTLAEESNPVSGVTYQKSGSHILVSKYSKTDPLEEFTAGQALAIPVIDGADSIYILNAAESGNPKPAPKAEEGKPKPGGS